MDTAQIIDDSEKQDKMKHIASCQNCGSQLVGEFCHQCGQQHIAERLSFRLLVKWVTESVLNLDRGLGRLGLTIYELFIDPGGMAQRYIAGQRKRYNNPFVYLFLWTALSLLVNTLLGRDFRNDVRGSLIESYQNLTFLSPVQLEALVDISLRLDTYSAQLTVLLSIPLALLLRLNFRKKTSYNLAEIFVFTIFIFGQAKFIDIFLNLFISFFHLNFNFYLYSFFFFTMVGFIYGGVRFFGQGFRGASKIVITLILVYLIYSLAQMIILLAYVFLFY